MGVPALLRLVHLITCQSYFQPARLSAFLVIVAARSRSASSWRPWRQIAILISQDGGLIYGHSDDN